MENLLLNETVDLEIIDINTDGQGVAKYQQYTVFVDKATIGDQVIAQIKQVKANYLVAKTINIRKPSANRQSPLCPYFGICGSCQLQNLNYEAQLNYKQKTVTAALVRIGKFSQLPEIKFADSSEQFYYRNKAQFPICRLGKEVQLGYYRQNSHRPVNLQECHLHHQDFLTVALAFKKLLQEQQLSIYNEVKHSGLIRHLCLRVSQYTKELQMAIVINGTDFFFDVENFVQETNQKLTKYRLASVLLNINTTKGNNIFGNKNVLLWGQEYICEKVGKHFFRLSPNTFLQVNLTQAEKLYADIYQRLPENCRTVLDLYCGIGTISLNISDRAVTVIGIEQNQQAVKDAKQNAKNNDVNNVEFFNCDSEQVNLGNFENIDVVIVDPPRKGLDGNLIDQLNRLPLKNLFYVSCNPATLARDLAAFDYKVKEIRLYDLFPQTTHVETLVWLSRN